MDFNSALSRVHGVRGGFPDDHHPQCMCPVACGPIKLAQEQLAVQAFAALIDASRARRESQQEPQRGVKRGLEEDTQEPRDTRRSSFRKV